METINKNQKRKRIIIFAIIILAAIIALVTLRTKTKDKSIITPSSDKIKISNIEVNNFYKSEKFKNSQGDSLFVQNEKYQITYLPVANMFLISIVSSPFHDIRIDAERDLIERLGIERTQACQLTVRISTPYFANPEESGKVYHLSFCQ